MICSGDMYAGVPTNSPVMVMPGCFQHPRQAEVVDAQPAVGREQQVGRLDVAVDDAVLVGVIAGRRPRRRSCGRPCRSSRPPDESDDELRPAAVGGRAGAVDVGDRPSWRAGSVSDGRFANCRPSGRSRSRLAGAAA